MLNTVKIRQAGYQVRIPIAEFLKQFSFLFDKKVPDMENVSKSTLRGLLESIGVDNKQYQIGKTKVFMREEPFRFLKDRLQMKLNQAAVKIQKVTKGYLCANHFIDMNANTVIIQVSYF